MILAWWANEGDLLLCSRWEWRFPTLSPDFQEAGSSTSLRFAQKDGARAMVRGFTRRDRS
jgi:hypothetical protein